MSTAVAATKGRHQSSVALAVLLIVLGLIAIALPMLASFGVVRVLAWLILFDGVAQLVYAFRSEGVGRTIWKVLVALLYLAAGVYLLVHPLLGLKALTLVLAFFFLAEGFMDIGTYLFAKGHRSGWLLFHGVITLLLGGMIWRQWPVSSFWLVGTLVGISMLMTGMTRLMMALELRRVANATA
jgi:uncharacterized membrane protein HdeD (DUF308 family)